MKRIVTYDIKEGNSYDEFYNIADQYKAIQITESTYCFDTDLDRQDFVKLIKTCFNKGDNVYYISVGGGKLFYEKIDI